MKNINHLKAEGLGRVEKNTDPIIQLMDLAVRNKWTVNEALAYHNEVIQRAIKNY
jgi:hypothetical protein